MAESTLTLTFDDVANDVAQMLGMARTRATRATAENTEVDGYVNKGYRQFITPPWADAGLPPHVWTFIKLDTTVTMTADTETTDCPDDFGFLLTDALHYTDSDTAPFHSIKVRSRDYILAHYEDDDDYSEDPAYVCLRPKAFTTATGQRFELRWYPVTDTAHVVSFPYAAIPNATSSTSYMQGGALHSETLRLSCRAIADAESNDELGREWARFLTALRASFAVDVHNEPRIYGNVRDFDTARQPRLTRTQVVHGNVGTSYS